MNKKTKKDAVLQLVEERNGYTVRDLATKLFKDDTWYGRHQVYGILNSLRKDGVFIYPRNNGEEVIIPQNAKDFKDVITHVIDEGALPSRNVKALNLLLESTIKYPALLAENNRKLAELYDPIQKASGQLKRLESPKKSSKK